MEQKKNSSNVHGTTTKVVLLPGLEFSDVVVLSTGLSGAYIRFGGAISGEYSVDSERAACGYAVGLCAITWDGQVATCALDADAENVYGNVGNATIADIWAKRNRELVDLHFQHRFEELPSVCRRCQDWRIIGEQRWDAEGKIVIKKYDASAKMIEGH